MTPKMLAFAGSLRKDSFNARLVRVAAGGARAAGAEVTVLDLREHRLPLFDQDLEAAEGLPETAQRLKELFRSHHGLLIASPEYNSSLTGVLKNTIDWVSRPEPGEPPLSCFAGKVAGIMAASPGALGGLRGLVHLRAILSNIKVLVIPDQVAVPAAGDAFADDGSIRDDKRHKAVQAIGHEVTTLVARIHAG